MFSVAGKELNTEVTEILRALRVEALRVGEHGEARFDRGNLAAPCGATTPDCEVGAPTLP